MFRNIFSIISFVLILLSISASNAVFAQEFLLKGVLFQKQNNKRVANALISNPSNKITVASNDLGAFNIKATVGDTLRISKKDFTEYIFTVTDQKDLFIQLSPVIQLNEVKIVEKTKKQELNEAMRQYRSQGTFFNGKPPLKLFSPIGGSPITGFYELFGKTPNQARKFQAYAKKENEQIDIDKRFNKSVIKQFTDLNDEQVEQFMGIYRPSHDQLTAWNDYDLINYIKASAQQLKDGKAPPPLKKLF